MSVICSSKNKSFKEENFRLETESISHRVNWDTLGMLKFIDCLQDIRQLAFMLLYLSPHSFDLNGKKHRIMLEHRVLPSRRQIYANWIVSAKLIRWLGFCKKLQFQMKQTRKRERERERKYNDKMMICVSDKPIVCTNSIDNFSIFQTKLEQKQKLLESTQLPMHATPKKASISSKSFSKMIFVTIPRSWVNFQSLPPLPHHLVSRNTQTVNYLWWTNNEVRRDSS